MPISREDDCWSKRNVFLLTTGATDCVTISELLPFFFSLPVTFASETQRSQHRGTRGGRRRRTELVHTRSLAVDHIGLQLMLASNPW